MSTRISRLNEWLATGPFAWSDSSSPRRDARDAIWMVAVLAVATLLAELLDSMGLDHIIFVTYIIAVQLISIFTVRRAYCLVASAISVLVYNFFFTVPRYSFAAWGERYPATFVVIFTAAFISSTIVLFLRNLLHETASTSRRVRVLLETDHLMETCRTRDDIAQATTQQLSKLLDRDVTWRLPENAPDDGAAATEPPDASQSTVRIPVSTEAGPLGEVHIDARGRDLSEAERSMTEAVLSEVAIALERADALEERGRADVQAENERLRANLLRSISHDLRTPLTSISGNADILLHDDGTLGPETRRQLLGDIRSDATWLNATVENLLAITRLDNENVELNRTVELMDDIVEDALRHVRHDGGAHPLEVRPADDLIPVLVDARLMVQVVVNLVNNAFDHTPAGTRVTVSWRYEGDELVMSVADDGPGIDGDALPHIFDAFYTDDDGPEGRRRGVGLGLSLCRSIVEAHGGTILCSPVAPHGCAFSFTLPLFHPVEEAPYAE